MHDDIVADFKLNVVALKLCEAYHINTCTVGVQVGRTHWFKIDKARRELGYVPVVDPEEGEEATRHHPCLLSPVSVSFGHVAPPLLRESSLARRHEGDSQGSPGTRETHLHIWGTATPPPLVRCTTHYRPQ